MRANRISVCVLMAVAGASPVFSQVGSFRPIGFNVRVAAVSADGTTVIGDGPGDGGPAGFRWRVNEFITLGDLPGGISRSYARALSADGNVIYGYGSTATGIRLFHWQDGVMSVVPGIGDGFVDEFDPLATNERGDVLAGQWFTQNANRAYRMEDGIPVSLDNSGRFSESQGLSADGRVVGGTISLGDRIAAFRWENGVMTHLPSPQGHTFAEGMDVSMDGRAVVGSTSDGNSGAEAMMWRDGGMFPLGDLPGGVFRSRALASSWDGSVIVGEGYDGTFEDGVACVWEPGYGPRSLKRILSDVFGINMDGWILFDAVDVSADGRTIIGQGADPQGRERAWVATIPGPSAGVVCVLGAGLLVRRRR